MALYVAESDSETRPVPVAGQVCPAPSRSAGRQSGAACTGENAERLMSLVRWSDGAELHKRLQ
jgi:hypothetical protein